MTPAGRLHHSDQFPQRHPERISGTNNITPTLSHQNSEQQGTSQTQGQQQPKSPHVKRAKWHLGIRSQSRPDDM